MSSKKKKALGTNLTPIELKIPDGAFIDPMTGEMWIGEDAVKARKYYEDGGTSSFGDIYIEPDGWPVLDPKTGSFSYPLPGNDVARSEIRKLEQDVAAMIDRLKESKPKMLDVQFFPSEDNWIASGAIAPGALVERFKSTGMGIQQQQPNGLWTTIAELNGDIQWPSLAPEKPKPAIQPISTKRRYDHES